MAPKLRPIPQHVELPCCTAAFLLTLVRAIEENKSSVASSQSRAIHGMGSERFHAAVSHRLFPLWAVRGVTIAIFVSDDDMTRLVDHRLPYDLSPTFVAKAEGSTESGLGRWQGCNGRRPAVR